MNKQETKQRMKASHQQHKVLTGRRNCPSQSSITNGIAAPAIGRSECPLRRYLRRGLLAGLKLIALVQEMEFSVSLELSAKTENDEGLTTDRAASKYSNACIEQGSFHFLENFKVMGKSLRALLDALNKAVFLTVRSNEAKFFQTKGG